MCLVAWLSITFDLNLNPLVVKLRNIVLYALKMLLLSRPAIGVPRIAICFIAIDDKEANAPIVKHERKVSI